MPRGQRPRPTGCLRLHLRHRRLSGQRLTWNGVLLRPVEGQQRPRRRWELFRGRLLPQTGGAGCLLRPDVGCLQGHRRHRSRG